MGRSPAAALMAACTSRAAPSTFRFRSNWMVTEQPPRVLTEVISVTPAIWARRRDHRESNGRDGRHRNEMIRDNARHEQADGQQRRADRPANEWRANVH